ncbi:MAG: hypothetical protein GY700_17240 [Propionibacteriaceae bacterium]|nr:hypothetical protein [Propionibacteriaceae bacterium]
MFIRNYTMSEQYVSKRRVMVIVVGSLLLVRVAESEAETLMLGVMSVTDEDNCTVVFDKLGLGGLGATATYPLVIRSLTDSPVAVDDNVVARDVGFVRL